MKFPSLLLFIAIVGCSSPTKDNSVDQETAQWKKRLNEITTSYAKTSETVVDHSDRIKSLENRVRTVETVFTTELSDNSSEHIPTSVVQDDKTDADKPTVFEAPDTGELLNDFVEQPDEEDLSKLIQDQTETLLEAIKSNSCNCVDQEGGLQTSKSGNFQNSDTEKSVEEYNPNVGDLRVGYYFTDWCGCCKTYKLSDIKLRVHRINCTGEEQEFERELRINAYPSFDLQEFDGEHWRVVRKWVSVAGKPPIQPTTINSLVDEYTQRKESGYNKTSIKVIPTTNDVQKIEKIVPDRWLSLGSPESILRSTTYKPDVSNVIDNTIPYAVPQSPTIPVRSVGNYRTATRQKWSVNGLWGTPRSVLIQHLQTEHGMDHGFLSGLTRGQLIAFHDDQHNG